MFWKPWLVTGHIATLKFLGQIVYYKASCANKLSWGVHGGLQYCSIVIILILMCSIALSSSPAVWFFKTLNFMVNDYSMFDCLSTMNSWGPSDGASWLLYNWVDCWCTHAWDKKTREMDTNLSMRDQLYMRFRYFNDFWHGISVFVNFSLLYWVPPNAPSFTHYLPPLCQIFFESHTRLLSVWLPFWFWKMLGS